MLRILISANLLRKRVHIYEAMRLQQYAYLIHMRVVFIDNT